MRWAIMAVSMLVVAPVEAQVPMPEAPPAAGAGPPGAVGSPPEAVSPAAVVPRPPLFVFAASPDRIAPARQVALVEAAGPVPEAELPVSRAALLLTAATAVYVEDAPRIAEVTARACGEIRAAGRPASPFALLEAALQAKRSPTLAPNVPRKFEAFAARYRDQALRGR